MEEFFARIWENLVGRISGPLSFRLILQPGVAITLAILDGIRDARAGRRHAYLWAVVHEPEHRSALLREGWKAVGKVFTVALIIDVVYQFIVERWVYPGEAVIVAIVLAMVPYLLLRGPVSRVIRAAMRRP